MAKKKKRFFRKKKKQSKHNKFFSYNNEERIKRNFLYKDFSRSNSYNTRFTCSNFSYVNFYKSTMKYCGFNGGTFVGTEFKNANLRGSKFKGAFFKDVLFYYSKLDKVSFQNAKFENVIFVGTSIKNARGIKKSTPGITFFDTNPNIHVIGDVKKVIYEALENKYIKNSEVLCFRKKHKLNTVNILRLHQKFTEHTLILGLKKAKEKINKQFHTLSYLVAFIEREVDFKISEKNLQKNDLLLNSSDQNFALNKQLHCLCP